jgi:hypothetical protein
MLFILLAFFALTAKFLSDTNTKEGQDEAQITVNSLASAANAVHSQGKGASQIVTIRLPQGADLSPTKTFIGAPAGSSLPNNSININFASTDFFAISDVRLVGSFPSSPGVYQYKAVSRGAYVEFSPHLADLSQNSLQISMGQSDSRSGSISISPATDEPVNVYIDYAWPYAGVVDVSGSPTFQTVNFGGGSISYDFASSASASGPYSYEFNLTFEGATSGLTENVSFPVSVFVNS